MSLEDPVGPVCVLGFGRSGTSLTTSVLGRLGLDLGPEETMLPAAANDNPRGFWEQDPIRILNDDLLEFLGGRWYDRLELQPGWEQRADLAPFYERGRQIVKELFPADRAWAWKDPRTSLTLPFWRSIVKPAAYVVCIRNPVEAAASLAARDPVAHPRSDSLDSWLQHNCALLRSTRDDRRLFVFYDDWFDATSWQVERLCRFLDLSPPPGGVERVEALVVRDLRHHRSSRLPEVATEDVPYEVRAAYQLLRCLRYEDSHETAGTTELVEELWDRLRERRQVVSGLNEELSRQGEDVVRLQEQLARQSAQLDETRARLETLLRSSSWKITRPIRSAGRWSVTLKELGQGAMRPHPKKVKQHNAEGPHDQHSACIGGR